MVKVRFSSNLSLKKNRRWGLFLAVMGTMALVAVGGIVLIPRWRPAQPDKVQMYCAGLSVPKQWRNWKAYPFAFRM